MRTTALLSLLAFLSIGASIVVADTPSAKPATRPVAPAHKPATPSKPVETTGRLKVESIELLPPDPVLLSKASDRRKQAEAAEDEADNLRTGVARSKPTRTKPGEVGSRKRATSGDKKKAETLLEQAKKLRKEADEIEREARTPHHRLKGKDGNREIVLTTSRDLSAEIAKIVPGHTVTYSGTRTSADDRSEVFSISTIGSDGPSTPAPTGKGPARKDKR